jgi:uncharacterized damage-inducible protein DinB
MRRAIVILSLAAAPLAAQTQQGAPSLASSPTAAVNAVKLNWAEGHGYIEAAATQLPESLYNYRPVATVRSFAELFGHIAGAEMAMCAPALGDSAQAEDAIEKSAKTKAALVLALKESGKYCGRAYAITDDAANRAVKPGAGVTKLYMLVMNATHDWEHYGNLVTYLRMKGMVPPSSQPSKP